MVRMVQGKVVYKKCSICFLGGIFPSPIRQDIEKDSKGVIQYAADALQKALIEGIRAHFDDVYLVNLPFVSSFPKFYRKTSVPYCNIQEYFGEYEVCGESLKFINIPIIKMLDKERKAYYGLCKWGLNKSGAKFIIIYSVHSPFIKAAVDYKQKVDQNVRIILIVPDLPEFMSSKQNFLLKLLKKRDSGNLQFLYEQIDGYILLTDYMKERLPIEGKPYRVVEGIYREANHLSIPQIGKKKVFYSGTLAKRYGIMNLVNAFIKMRRTDCILEICGMGDAADEIRVLANSYSNIHYLGQIPRDEVLKRQSEAVLLVNPRTPEGEYTRYSFPSKTMEYLGSGVPTLLYKLPGIPKEYYEYCFTIEELGVDALAFVMNSILSLPEKELLSKGHQAREFILQNKNPKAQCAKLKSLIEDLTK